MRQIAFFTIELTASLVGVGLIYMFSLGTTIRSLAEEGSQTPLSIPDKLKVPETQVLLLKAIAKGTQIYTCKAKVEDTNAFAWTLKAPDAQLFNTNGQSIGSHYAGPTWELTDHSKVIGKVKAKVNAPQPNNIPWLLLAAKSHEGSGLLTQANWVQRLNTSGGQAAKTGCDRVHLNQELPVDYTADYYFYGTKATSGASN
jgi:hypothetical protein